MSPYNRTDDAVSILTQKGGGWSSFGACSRTCGEGIKTRVCNRPSNGPFPCRGKSVVQCNMGPCGSQLAADTIESNEGDEQLGKDEQADAEAASGTDDAGTERDESTSTTELQLLVQLSSDGKPRFHPGCCKERNMSV